MTSSLVLSGEKMTISDINTVMDGREDMNGVINVEGEKSKQTKGPFIKDVRTNTRKLPPSSCPCGHTVNLKKYKIFCTKNADVPCPKNVRNGQLPPQTADVFYGQPR